MTQGSRPVRFGSWGSPGAAPSQLDLQRRVRSLPHRGGVPSLALSLCLMRPHPSSAQNALSKSSVQTPSRPHVMDAEEAMAN